MDFTDNCGIRKIGNEGKNLNGHIIKQILIKKWNLF